MKVKNKSNHIHRYNIIGTSKVKGFIAVDIICKKCGKTGTCYVYDEYEEKIYKQASNGKCLRVPIDCVLTERQYIELLPFLCI